MDQPVVDITGLDLDVGFHTYLTENNRYEEDSWIVQFYVRLQIIVWYFFFQKRKQKTLSKTGK